MRCNKVQERADALTTLESVATGNVPILYRRHNAYMGSRHELGGQRGRYPKRCAALVKKVLVNAMANAENKGDDPDRCTWSTPQRTRR